MKDIRQQWKALAAERKINREDIAALCIYRSLTKNEGKEGAIGRLRKSFNPITNSTKLDNGAAPYYALSLALWCVKYSTILSWMDEEDKQQVLSIAKEIKIKVGEIL